MSVSLIDLLKEEAEELRREQEERTARTTRDTSSALAKAREQATEQAVKDAFIDLFADVELDVAVCCDIIERGGFGLNGGVHIDIVCVNDLLFQLKGFYYRDEKIGFTSFRLLYANPHTAYPSKLVDGFEFELDDQVPVTKLREQIRHFIASSPDYILKAADIIEAVNQAARDEAMREIRRNQDHQ